MRSYQLLCCNRTTTVGWFEDVTDTCRMIAIGDKSKATYRSGRTLSSSFVGNGEQKTLVFGPARISIWKLLVTITVSLMAISTPALAQDRDEASAIGETAVVGKLDAAKVIRYREICRQEDYICDDFIFEVQPEFANAIIYILDGINSQKKYAKNLSKKHRSLDEIVHWILIALGVLLTVVTTFSSKYPKYNFGVGKYRIPLPILPIFLSAIVSAVTSVSAYYKFDEYRKLNYGIAVAISELQSEIHFRLLMVDKDPQKITEKTIFEWRDRMDAIFNRYAEMEKAGSN